MIYSHIENLIKKAKDRKLIQNDDHIYARNQIYDILDLEGEPEPRDINGNDHAIPDILEDIIQDAIERRVIEDVLDDKEKLSADLMNTFLARPSVINTQFQMKYVNSPKKATDFFYQLSKDSNYIQMKRINKNIHFTSETEYGELDITINLSKPEKDPEQLKRERAKKQVAGYPSCVLCVENEGYPGRTGHPARANHRMIRVPLLDETWFFQYSPYIYYNEHSIILAGEHRNMKIDKTTFARLLAFVDQFPHYFLGSNADLPVVGGSILSHDHYQGGRYEFAMTHAKKAFDFDLPQFKDVSSHVLHWPLSVIRLQSSNKENLLQAADHILKTWINYSDETAQIRAFTDGVRHNTITPIARMNSDVYELDLVLRNNRTTDEHPLGIFHPHSDVHHIKKENIGLIEVMGLAVLPARLKEELAAIQKFLLGAETKVADIHKTWANELKEKYPHVKDDSEAHTILQKEVGKKFKKVLEDAGVFKDKEAFGRFIQAIQDNK